MYPGRVLLYFQSFVGHGMMQVRSFNFFTAMVQLQILPFPDDTDYKELLAYPQIEETATLSPIGTAFYVLNNSHKPYCVANLTITQYFNPQIW
jgi:hypothetical protein